MGSAKIKVVNNSNEKDNDSLVLMITYGKTKFLFTGDIENSAQTRISDEFANDKDQSYDIDLIKMPHHGSYTGTLYRFIRTFMPQYAIVSVGEKNKYGHPDSKSLDLLDDADVKTYRTDKNGDIIVKSDGKTLSFITSK